MTDKLWYLVLTRGNSIIFCENFTHARAVVALTATSGQDPQIYAFKESVLTAKNLIGTCTLRDPRTGRVWSHYTCSAHKFFVGFLKEAYKTWRAEREVG